MSNYDQSLARKAFVDGELIALFDMKNLLDRENALAKELQVQREAAEVVSAQLPEQKIFSPGVWIRIDKTINLLK